MKLPQFKPIHVAALSLAVLASTATAVDVNGELKRKATNEQRLAKMAPVMRPKVAAVLADLEGHGARPLIDVAVWRSQAEQAALVKRGVSKVAFSYHNASTPAGTADSLAADIVDQRWLWSAPNEYWLKLTSSAQAHGLATGLYWGLSTADRNKIHSIIARKQWAAPYARGWDPAHVEPVGITLAQAKRGVRPYGKGGCNLKQNLGKILGGVFTFLTIARKVDQTITAYNAFVAGGHEKAEAVLLAVQQTGLLPID